MANFRTTSRLNLRSGPGQDEAILCTLPAVHPVQVVGQPVPGSDWWEVATELDGSQLRGFVFAKYLAPITIIKANPPKAYYPTKPGQQVLRTSKDWARSLREDGAPDFAAVTDVAARIHSIIDWADVENEATHLRWAPGKNTYCNVYAHDVVHLAGGYIPRVWWTDAVLARLADGQPVDATVKSNYRELRANDLFEWLADYGPVYGWKPTSDLTALQSAANGGSIAVICATTRKSAPGHITVVLSERPGEPAEVEAGTGRVLAPRQSQAGRKNKRRFAGNWWNSNSFPAWSAWVMQ